MSPVFLNIFQVLPTCCVRFQIETSPLTSPMKASFSCTEDHDDPIFTNDYSEDREKIVVDPLPPSSAPIRSKKRPMEISMSKGMNSVVNDSKKTFVLNA